MRTEACKGTESLALIESAAEQMETIDSASWRKSSYSGTNGGGCVEAGVAQQGRVLVRDTTNRNGAVAQRPRRGVAELYEAR